MSSSGLVAHGLVLVSLVVLSVSGCGDDPTGAQQDLRIDDWGLAGRVEAYADSVRAEVELTNLSARSRVPPVYNALCGVELRVYDGPYGPLPYDGVTSRGCLDVGYSVQVPSGRSVTITQTIGLAELTAAGLDPGTVYHGVAVLRLFAGLRGVEVLPTADFVL